MIVNTAAYHFITIDAPQLLAAQICEQAQAAELKGTVLVASEGVNLFLAGNESAIDGFYAWFKSDERFSPMRVKYSRSQAQPFARLKVKIKSEIISFRKDQASPLETRAPAVAPKVLQRWLRQGRDDDGRRVVMLDTRNQQEVAYGTFAGALTLPIDKFTELPEAVMAHREDLADATIVSFCTGGIRCEKAALWMRAQGMDNVLQLDSGILGYFEEVGADGYEGGCFVFDERVALDPQLQPLCDGGN